MIHRLYQSNQETKDMLWIMRFIHSRISIIYGLIGEKPIITLGLIPQKLGYLTSD